MAEMYLQHFCVKLVTVRNMSGIIHWNKLTILINNFNLRFFSYSYEIKILNFNVVIRVGASVRKYKAFKH